MLDIFPLWGKALIAGLAGIGVLYWIVSSLSAGKKAEIQNAALRAQSTSQAEAAQNEEEQRKARDEELNKTGTPTMNEWRKLIVFLAFLPFLYGCASTPPQGGRSWMPKIEAPKEIEFTEEDEKDLNDFSIKPVARKILNQGLAWRALYRQYEAFRWENNRKCLESVGTPETEALAILGPKPMP